MKPLSVVFLGKSFLICSESTYYLLLRSSITKNTHPFHRLLDLLSMSVDLFPNVGQEAKYTHMLDSMIRSGKIKYDSCLRSCQSFQGHSSPVRKDRCGLATISQLIAERADLPDLADDCTLLSRALCVSNEKNKKGFKNMILSSYSSSVKTTTLWYLPKTSDFPLMAQGVESTPLCLIQRSSSPT